MRMHGRALLTTDIGRCPKLVHLYLLNKPRIHYSMDVKSPPLLVRDEPVQLVRQVTSSAPTAHSSSEH